MDETKDMNAAPVEPIVRLRELANQLPRGLQSDWHGSNHYELTSPYDSEEYWWLVMGDYFQGVHGIPCDTTEGKRLGLLMDIAAEVARLRDEGSI